MKDNSIEYKIKTSSTSVRPFIYERPSVSSVCIRILILLLLQVVALFITKSYKSIYVITASTLGAFASISILYLINKEESYHFMTTIIQGLIIGMLLPENYPVVTVFFISLFCLFLSRFFIFKNINAWINVAAVAVVIAWFIGRNFFPDFIITNDLITLKNSSMYLIQNGQFHVFDFDAPVTSFLNNNIFKYFKVTLPEGYVSLLVDTQSIIPAFRFNLLIILSSIVLFSDNSFSSIIPICFLIVYGVLVRLFVPYIFGGMLNQGDIILAFLTSGTLFCIVYMIQWYGTTPLTITGKIFFGILTGAVAFITSGCGTSPIGMVYTVLICNILSLMIRVLEEMSNRAIVYKNVEKYLTGDKNK